DVVAEEVNVRNVVLTDDVASVATEQLQLVPKALGPRLGKEVQTVIKAHKTGDWTVENGTVTVGGVELLDGEYTLKLVADDSIGDGMASTGLGRSGGVVALDIRVTEELEVEGRARDLIRLVQQARRDADLHVSDRIALTISAETATVDAVARHLDLIATETLATSVETVMDVGLPEPKIVVAKTTVR
ncbi:MAG: DUF5915 domain-containing protein, partial [Ilumatobacter sp.]|nr:DUF5915 domain-containing protein [Ilumatobacter sp.]